MLLARPLTAPRALQVRRLAGGRPREQSISCRGTQVPFDATFLTALQDALDRESSKVRAVGAVHGSALYSTCPFCVAPA